MPFPQGKLLAGEEVQANVSSRVEQAMQDLALKAEIQRQERERKEQEARERAEKEKEDEEVEAIRQARIKKMMNEKEREEANRAKGYGELSIIDERQFGDIVLNCYRAVIHFFRRDYQKCQIVEARLKVLAAKHLETRFVSLDVEKAPFYVERLKVRSLPAVLCFENGKYIGRTIGLQGSNETEQINELEIALAKIGIILDPRIGDFNKARSQEDLEDDDEGDDGKGGRSFLAKQSARPGGRRDDDEDW